VPYALLASPGWLRVRTLTHFPSAQRETQKQAACKLASLQATLCFLLFVNIFFFAFAFAFFFFFFFFLFFFFFFFA